MSVADEGIEAPGPRAGAEFAARIRARRLRVAIAVGIAMIALTSVPVWWLTQESWVCDMSTVEKVGFACSWDDGLDYGDGCDPTTLGSVWLDMVVFAQLPCCLVLFLALRWQVRRREPPPSRSIVRGFDGVLLGFMIALFLFGFGFFAGWRFECWTLPGSLRPEVFAATIVGLASGIVLGLPLGLLATFVFHLAERPIRRIMSEGRAS